MGSDITKSGATTPEAIERVLMVGDLKELNSEQRIAYYRNVCESVGLNPLTRPFEYLTLSGKLVLYARKDATEQIRATRGVSLRIPAREVHAGAYVVTAEATDRTGRIDSATGVVWIDGLKGEALANAMMKAETKAKRRVTLSIAGLGLLDESEVDSIPGARPFGGEPARPVAEAPKADATTGEVIEPEWMAGDDAVAIDPGDLAALREDVASSGISEQTILDAYRIKDLADLPAEKTAEVAGRIAQYVIRKNARAAS